MRESPSRREIVSTIVFAVLTILMVTAWLLGYKEAAIKIVAIFAFAMLIDMFVDLFRGDKT